MRRLRSCPHGTFPDCFNPFFEMAVALPLLYGNLYPLDRATPSEDAAVRKTPGWGLP